MNLLPILTCQIKARACDEAVEGKGGAGSFREGERGRSKRDNETEGWRERKMEEEEVEDGAEPRNPEELQVAKDVIAGDRAV